MNNENLVESFRGKFSPGEIDACIMNQDINRGIDLTKFFRSTVNIFQIAQIGDDIIAADVIFFLDFGF